MFFSSRTVSTCRVLEFGIKKHKTNPFRPADRENPLPLTDLLQFQMDSIGSILHGEKIV